MSCGRAKIAILSIRQRAEMELEKIEAASSGRYVYLDAQNHLYMVKSERNDITYFTCRLSKSLGCRARITHKRNVFLMTANHNHPSDETHVRVLRFRQRLRRRVCSETTPIQQIFAEEEAKDPEVARHVGSFSSLRTTLYRARQVAAAGFVNYNGSTEVFQFPYIYD